MVPDPISVALIQSSLQAVSDEMFVAMRKMAMSSVIYEVLDMGTAVTDGEGELTSSGSGIPGFVGVLDKSVKAILANNAREEIRAGDVFVTNDPFYGGVTHLNDIVIAMPVFTGDEIIAWTTNIAHHNDVGGLIAGSMSNEATEIYQEGLRLPAVKLIDRGEPIRSVFEILAVNGRLPDLQRGDLWAGIAAARLGARRVQEVVQRYGVALFKAAISEFMDYGEQVTLRALRALPKGRWTIEEEQDSGVTYQVTVEIADDTFTIDLRNNPDQDPGPYNCCHDGAVIAGQMVLKNVTESDVVANAGTFRPLRVLTRAGSVFDAQEPAAFAIYSEVEIRLYDLILRCLAEQLPGRLPAGGFASICGTFIGGRHPDTGRHFTIVEPQVGGWGASPTADGNSAQFSPTHGETFNCPAEIAEARYGLYVEQHRLSDEPGGDGKYRGGKGIVLDYRARGDGLFLTCAYTRSRQPPWPLEGGLAGSSNYVELLRADGTGERFATTTGLVVNRGDLIRIHTANGAGHGDPRERPADRVLEDVRLGYINERQAAEVYGQAALAGQAR